MDQIVQQLIIHNQKDFWNIIETLIPIFLTIVIIVQNRIYAHRTEELQKQIYNRDRKKQFHDDVLRIYNTYYDFCDVIVNSGFAQAIENGDINVANANINNLFWLRANIIKNFDLARLIFARNNQELYNVIEDAFDIQIKIVSKYIEYITGGRMWIVTENAWNIVMADNLYNKYNYAMLSNLPEKREAFLSLCKKEEVVELEGLLKECQNKFSYENFDKFFEEYFSEDIL